MQLLPSLPSPPCGNGLCALHRVASRQRGQALIFGLFVLVGGLTALFFLFNAGQLVLEKDKLTTTADAVAYSGGVMRARALNFTAYTNRALVANEVAVAQWVSLASWTRYTERHAAFTAREQCGSVQNVPAARQFLHYAPLCVGLFYSGQALLPVRQLVQASGQSTVAATAVAKAALMGAQGAMMASLAAHGHRVLTQVAEANFRNAGEVRVDTLPLEDDFFLFDGRPFLSWHTGDGRQRLADVAVQAAHQDPFVAGRNWSDAQLLGHACGAQLPQKDRIDRSGGTQLIGLDEWRANDRATDTRRVTRFLRCRTRTTVMATGAQSAGGRTAGHWAPYTGIPNFLDLSASALANTPENRSPAHRDARLLFSIRLTREVSQTATSEGRSNIRQAADGGSHGLNPFRSKAARGEYAAVGTAEVFFDRPLARTDGRQELANAFNPYWQVHLVETSPATMALARLLQGVLF